MTVNKPAGTAQDDVLIALVYLEHGTATITPPSGWTLVRDSLQTGPPTYDYRHVTYWKRAGGSEPSSYEWSFSASAYREALVIAVQGCVASGSPIDAEAATANSGQDDAPVAPSVTTTVVDTLLVAVCTTADGGAAVWSPGSSGMTERVDSVSIAAYDVVQASAGATGSKMVSCTGGSNPEWHVCGAIALKPPAGAAVSQTIIAACEALAAAVRTVAPLLEALALPFSSAFTPLEALRSAARAAQAPVEAQAGFARVAGAPWEAQVRPGRTAVLPWEATSTFTLGPGLLALAAEYTPALSYVAEFAAALDLPAEYGPVIDLEAKL
ncbi:MAG: hypothetical protein WEE64_07455 [Dehalococcoidia bacterium]